MGLANRVVATGTDILLVEEGTVRLPKLMGLSYTLDLNLTVRPFVAKEVLQMGLASNRSGEQTTYRLVHIGKNAEMWNTVFREYQFQHPDCQGFLSWYLEHEEKRGLVWRERAICSTCNYSSNMFELYEEMPRRGSGRKTAGVNNAIQIGLSQTSMCPLLVVLFDTPYGMLPCVLY